VASDVMLEVVDESAVGELSVDAAAESVPLGGRESELGAAALLVGSGLDVSSVPCSDDGDSETDDVTVALLSRITSLVEIAALSLLFDGTSCVCPDVASIPALESWAYVGVKGELDAGATLLSPSDADEVSSFDIAPASGSLSKGANVS
jgi:hypothetical protein